MTFRILAAGAMVAAALGAPGITKAQATSVCAELAGAVESGHKNLSYNTFAGFATSAPQATQKATEIANDLALIEINLSLLAANKCPMPTKPISAATYALPALECATADSRSDEGKAKCNRANWKPLGTK